MAQLRELERTNNTYIRLIKYIESSIIVVLRFGIGFFLVRKRKIEDTNYKVNGILDILIL